MKNNNLLSVWFIRLRWFAFIAQIIILTSTVIIFKSEINWQLIGGILLLIPVSNVFATSFLTKTFPARTTSGILIILDSLILAAILYFSGGAANPFTIVFLLHLVLTAILLNAKWTWFMTIWTCGLYGLVFFYSPESSHSGHHHHQSSFSLHLYGMLFAFITVAILVAYFLNKIIAELRDQELKLQKLEHLVSNNQRLSSLVTITAGAAHELGTPLSTIAVVSKDLESQLKKLAVKPEIIEDLQLILQEVARCKDSLSALSERTGDLTGETPQATSIQQLLEETLEPLNNPNHLFKITGNVELKVPQIPVKSVTIALRALIKNALDATKENPKVVNIVCDQEAGKLTIKIEDHGEGMSAQTLELLGEPFFSTKSPEQGMGLGVYLAKLTAQQLSGNLTFSSNISKGTCANFSFPINPHHGK